jgi:hypothetical protein
MMKKEISKKRDAVFKVTVLIVVFVLWVTVAPETAFLWTVFLAWWAFRFDSRILAGVAMAFLVGTAVASAFHADARAEQLAVYVYFLLVMVAALQILEYRREGGGEEGEEWEDKEHGSGEEGAPCQKGAVPDEDKIFTEVHYAGHEVMHADRAPKQCSGKAVPWVGPKNVRYPDISL